MSPLNKLNYRDLVQGRRHVQHAHQDSAYDGIGFVFRQSVSESVVDVGHLEPFDRVVNDVRHESDIFDAEASFVDAFLEDELEDAVLFFIKSSSELLHHPDVSEELRSERAVSQNGFTDDAQVSVDECKDFLFRFCVHFGDAFHFLRKERQLFFNDGIVNLLFVSEVGVERSPPAPGSLRDVVHRGCFKPVLGKKFACNFNESLSGLGDWHR